MRIEIIYNFERRLTIDFFLGMSETFYSHILKYQTTWHVDISVGTASPLEPLESTARIVNISLVKMHWL